MKMVSKWRELLANFGASYYETPDRVIGPCPVHQGLYQSSFNININPDNDYYGKWFCNSDQCHKIYGTDLVGLAYGLLKAYDENVNFGDAVRYCQKLCSDVTGDYSIVENDTVTNFLVKNKPSNNKYLTKSVVRSRLKIPSSYYINRGFSPQILDEFDIGYCDRVDAQMYGRVVFPVYSTDGQWVIGCTGRRTTEGPNKWINSKGFSKASYLYAYDRAIKRAKELGALILVEGQGDVLRMHEAGIINTMGIFGCSLSDSQEFLLQGAGVMNIILALDNNEAGQNGNNLIKERLQYLFNIHTLIPTKNDIGDMSVAEVHKLVQSIRKFV